MERQSINAQGQNQQNQSSEKDPIVKGLNLINEGIKTMNLNLSQKFDQLSQQIELRDQNFFNQMETRDQNLSSKLSEVPEQLKTLDGKINKLKGGKVEKNKSFTRFNLYRDFLERNKRVVPKKMFYERTSHNINTNTKKIETYIAKNEIKHSKGSENTNISITKKSVNSSSDIQCNYQGNSNSKSNSLKTSEQQERYSHTQNKIDKENISSPDEVKESKGNEKILTKKKNTQPKTIKTLNKSKTRINSNLKKEKEKEKVGANANKSCAEKKGSKKEGDKSGNNYQSFTQKSINMDYNGEYAQKKK